MITKYQAIMLFAFLAAVILSTAGAFGIHWIIGCFMAAIWAFGIAAAALATSREEERKQNDKSKND